MMKNCPEAGCDCDEPAGAAGIVAASKPRTMTLLAALSTLVQAHTRDDDLTGFTVEWRPRIEDWGRGAYVEAWDVVRGYLRSDEPVCVTDGTIASVMRAVHAAGFNVVEDMESGVHRLVPISATDAAGTPAKLKADAPAPCPACGRVHGCPRFPDEDVNAYDGSIMR